MQTPLQRSNTVASSIIERVRKEVLMARPDLGMDVATGQVLDEESGIKRGPSTRERPWTKKDYLSSVTM